jgi:hypothetical protein
VLLEALALFRVVLSRAAHVEALGEDDQLGAVRGGGAREAIRIREVALDVVRRLELYGCGPHPRHSSLRPADYVD